METLIGLGLIILIFFVIPNIDLNNKVDNYPISRVDTSKMVADKVRNNLSAKVGCYFCTQITERRR